MVDMVGPVNVVIVGGHGKIALRLEKLLAERGDSPRGIIRKTEQAADLEAIGAEPIVLDIENVDDISDALAEADSYVVESGLDHTILRPGYLTDDPGTGKVQIAEHLDRGSVTREDVAAVIAECLVADNTIGKAVDLTNDGKPIAEAVRSL